MASVPGGLKQASEASAEGIAAANQVKSEVEAKLGKTFTQYKPVQERTQVVAGVNYFIKVQVGDNDFIHLRIYKDLQGKISLSGVQAGKSKDDSLEYFQE